MRDIERLCEEYMIQLCDANPDPSHDILHVKRVVRLAKHLAGLEGADLAVVVPAAYLHDCVYVSKTSELRSRASSISADRAMELLRGWGYAEELLPRIHHAIASHSFSARIPAETLEARIVQDADRLDAMGAVGIFRCFAFSGLSGKSLYREDDPFCVERRPDDRTNTLDHFYAKLLGLHAKLNTVSAKLEGERRLRTMEAFIHELRYELQEGGSEPLALHSFGTCET